LSYIVKLSMERVLEAAFDDLEVVVLVGESFLGESENLVNFLVKVATGIKVHGEETAVGKSVDGDVGFGDDDDSGDAARVFVVGGGIGVDDVGKTKALHVDEIGKVFEIAVDTLHVV